jgi:calcium-dependent protein kinase
LGDLLKRYPHKYLPEDHAKALIRQLVSAVAHIHSRGICHRDIKLQNILLENMDDANPQVKLIDFGFATRFVGVTPLRTRCGTPYATAPEVYRECYDERCDVWSAGVVSYILLCGHRPFVAVDLPGDLKNAGRAAMVTNIMMARYHFNYQAFQSVSAEGVNFIRAMLHPTYLTRWAARDALNSSWLSKTGATSTLTFASLKEKDTALSLAVANLRSKGTSSSLENTSMVAVAFSQPQQNALELRSLFQSFDTDSLGYLTKQAFRKAMKFASPDLSQIEIDQLFSAIDVDNDQQISFTEFLAATIDPREVDVEELGKAFRLLDSDNKGYLTVDDFYRVLAAGAKKHDALQLSKKSGAIKGGDQGKSDRDGSRSRSRSRRRSSLSGSDDISKSGAAYYDEGEQDAYSERERTTLMKKIAAMIKQADLNHDGVLSYSEFLLGVVGSSDGSGIMGPDLSVDSLPARDIFDHGAMSKGSEKMMIKSLLASTTSSPRSLRSSGLNRIPFFGRRSKAAAVLPEEDKVVGMGASVGTMSANTAEMSAALVSEVNAAMAPSPPPDLLDSPLPLHLRLKRSPAVKPSPSPLAISSYTLDPTADANITDNKGNGGEGEGAVTIPGNAPPLAPPPLPYSPEKRRGSDASDYGLDGADAAPCTSRVMGPVGTFIRVPNASVDVGSQLVSGPPSWIVEMTAVGISETA